MGRIIPPVMSQNKFMDIKPILEEELKTMYRMIQIMEPKSEAEFIAVTLPNLHVRLFHELQALKGE